LFAKDLEYVLGECFRQSDVSPVNEADLASRADSLRRYGKLPRGRENRGRRLSTSEITAAILGLVPVNPNWAGHAAVILGDLRPVGGATASFRGAAEGLRVFRSTWSASSAAQSGPGGPGGRAVKRKRFSVEQITSVLQQVAGGMPVGDVCRQVGISEQTFYRWKKDYGGMLPSEARELKQLRDENGKLKRLVADLSLDKIMLQDVVQKKF
jgi:putative transposase